MKAFTLVCSIFIPFAFFTRAPAPFIPDLLTEIGVLTAEGAAEAGAAAGDATASEALLSPAASDIIRGVLGIADATWSTGTTAVVSQYMNGPTVQAINDFVGEDSASAKNFLEAIRNSEWENAQQIIDDVHGRGAMSNDDYQTLTDAISDASIPPGDLVSGYRERSTSRERRYLLMDIAHPNNGPAAVDKDTLVNCLLKAMESFGSLMSAGVNECWNLATDLAQY